MRQTRSRSAESVTFGAGNNVRSVLSRAAHSGRSQTLTRPPVKGSKLLQSCRQRQTESRSSSARQNPAHLHVPSRPMPEAGMRTAANNTA